MLGEVGWKRVEYKLDKKVERWGMRLMKSGEGKLGREMRIRGGEKGGVYIGGWMGRMLSGVKKHKLEGERWEVERERIKKLGWKISIGRGKEEEEKKWEEGRKWREDNVIVGVSDASGEKGRIGIGGSVWEGKEKLGEFSKNRGWGLTVGEGEMWGVEEVLKRMESYKENRKKGIIGVDNVGVLEKLRKGRGMCKEREQNVRRIGERLLEKGWELEFKWVPGHIGIEENEEADEKVKEGVWEEEDEEVEETLCWGKWEQRRKEEERRVWKEYWSKDRKGEEYFGVGSDEERGHEGPRWESKFLFWMRTGHGAMRGARYIKERGNCKCGGKETRDHILLYCGLWEKERKEVWEGWEGGVFKKEG
ncbi:hypothetical protein L873DRAFT_1813912 [Choiromyces venosus 120613-1]|uniref:RNase H type-1 domain-containing protein n=1 Tax=Choiromyces venosus 120613-1 TaxID=1336337 RepID=A0A3N4JLA7_9PEZI|nr:hypothetical protein L873DRAFT_1813912 [Choiromyces venosus 120613-1]